VDGASALAKRAFAECVHRIFVAAIDEEALSSLTPEQVVAV